MRSLPASIVILTSDFPPDSGGLQRMTERLARSAQALGAEVLVIAPSHAGSDNVDSGLPFTVQRYAHGNRREAIVAMAQLTRTAIRERSADCVIAMSWHSCGVALKLAQFGQRRIQAIVLAHGTEIAHQRGLLRTTAMRIMLAGAEVVANSRYTAQLLLNRGVKKVRIVHPGADPVNVAAVERAANPTVLVVGRLVPRKGVDRLIEVVARLLPRLPDLQLVVVGGGPDRERVTDLAQQLGVAEHVIFAGSVDDDRLNRLYAEAWCFAMPNRVEGTDVEGFGIVFLEAALHGLASIGGRGSGAEDAIIDGETGLLVDGNDTIAIEHAVAQLLDDRAFADRLANAGRERALRDFSWEAYAKQLFGAAR